MIQQSYSMHLLARDRVNDLHREAAEDSLRRAARAERRRAAREAALEALKAEVAELERRATYAWQSRQQREGAHASGWLRGAR